ncbi:hypothetical protein [Streptomyces sp. SID3343]
MRKRTAGRNPSLRAKLTVGSIATLTVGLAILIAVSVMGIRH